jgi:galactose mutarotase-like enzyme
MDVEHVTLKDPASSLTATFVPGAGMIGTSLADGDVEYLGQRRGLDAYVSAGKTMGIPILYPWANRLGGNTYEADGRAVTVAGARVRMDEHGSPIHGLLAAYPGWQVREELQHSLTAAVDFGADAQLLASFPFPHVLTQRVTLAARTLTIETTVEPTSSAAVPLCFGYHPYFVIPGVARDDWQLTTPRMRRLPVNDSGIPTGAHADWRGGSQQLAGIAYDDGFDEVPDNAVFTLAGGDRRIDVRFETGYPAAQLFAPAGDDLVAIEPMAAPTDSLRRGGYRVAAPGAPTTTRFSISVR